MDAERFNNAIRLLRYQGYDELVAILEAAKGVDRERALAYLAKWKNCFGSGHLDDESEDDMRECIRTEIQLRALIEALPKKEK